MRILRTALLVGGLTGMLAACGSSTNPFITNSDPADNGTDGTGTNANGIPEAVAGNLERVSYSPGAGTITVEGIDLDDAPFEAVYNRNSALDVPGYQAYTIQDDPLDRHVTAYAAQSGNSGSARGVLVVTGGQFNRYFGGVYYERDGNYSPATGQVSYAGSYVGVTNVGHLGGDLLPVPAGTDPTLLPYQAAEVRGSVFLNANFDDNAVNGGIYALSMPDANMTLPSLALIATDIASDGSFSGEIEYTGVVGTSIGTYSGLFSGPNSESVVGGVRLTEFDGSDSPRWDNEEQYGLFVLDQCGTASGTAPECSSVNP
ncbi:MAG: thymidylate synthase [Paracoccaceae bacterium]